MKRRAGERATYTSLRALLQAELMRDEDPATAELIGRLRPVKRRGWFSRAEFLEMCRWKSPRPSRHYERNSAAAIRGVSRTVLATRSERARMQRLDQLHGVSVPVASAILTLIDPARYGVLDIRVWRLLFTIRSVEGNPRGRGFTLRQWFRYLRELRSHAKKLGVPVRAVEYTLFSYHKKAHEGRLYAAPAPRASRPPRTRAMGNSQIRRSP